MEQAEQLTATGEKRRRLKQACLVCRGKKTKCDGVKPCCGNCRRLDQVCQYGPLHQKRKTRRKHIEVLEQRLAQMERLLKPLPTEEGDRSSSSSSPASVSSSPSSKNNKYQFRPLNDKSILPPINVSHGLSNSHHRHQVIDMDPSLLPPRPLMDQLVAKYLDRLYGVSPFFYRDDLMDLERCPVVVQMAIAAATAKYCPATEQPIWFAGEKYAEKIRQRINDIVDMPSISHVQVMMLMIMHEFGCARGTRTWMYCGIAGRMVLELGLHKEPSHLIKDGEIMSVATFKAHELRRNVFWGMYIFDRFGGASCARPVMFHDDDIDCHLPCQDDCLDQSTFYSESLDGTQLNCYKVVDRDDHGQAQTIQLYETISQPTTTAAAPSRSRCPLGWPTHMIRLISMFSKVAKFVNRTLAKSTSPLAPYDTMDVATNRDYSLLSDELDTWYEQLPFHMRNTPANLERHRTEESPDTHRFLLSHILHNALVVFLNRPALTFLKTLETVSTHQKEMVQLGVEKCLAASDNVSIMLTDINQHVERVFPFISYLTYSTATVVVHTIFTGKPAEAKKAAEALKAHCLFLQNMRKYYAMADMFFFRIRDFYGIHKNKVHVAQDDSTDQQPKTMDLLTDSPTSSTIPSPYEDSSNNANNNRLLDDLVGSLDDTFSLLLEQSFQPSHHLQEQPPLPVLSSSLVPSMTTDWTFDTQPFFLNQQAQPYMPPAVSPEPSGSVLWSLPPP